MAETDTSPAALRALADELDSIDISSGEMVAEHCSATLRALAAEKEAATADEDDGGCQRDDADPGPDCPWGEACCREDVRAAALGDEEGIRADISAEKEAGAPAPAQGPLTEVGETSRGYKLYRAPNPVGGNTYWSDEIGGGVVVWDTCLVGEETLRLALAIEAGAPAPDSWIPWEGGECPVPGDAMVCVQFRGQTEVYAPSPAGSLRWSHQKRPADIVAYRLSKEGTP